MRSLLVKSIAMLAFAGQIFCPDRKHCRSLIVTDLGTAVIGKPMNLRMNMAHFVGEAVLA